MLQRAESAQSWVPCGEDLFGTLQEIICVFSLLGVRKVEPLFLKRRTWQVLRGAGTEGEGGGFVFPLETETSLCLPPPLPCWFIQVLA